MIIIDYSQIAVGILHTEMRGALNGDINVELVRHMILNSIRSYRMKFHGEYGEIVIACDSKKSWRKDAFQYYKANRKKDRDESGTDWNQIFSILNMVKLELNQFFPYAVVEVDLAEADDVIAVLTEKYHDENVLIISGDHDFIQLQKYNNVKQFSPVEKKFVKPDKGQHPNIALVEHILVGDRGDGIPNFMSPDDTLVSGARNKSIMKNKLKTWVLQDLDTWSNSPYAANIKRNKMLIDFSEIPMEIKESILSNYDEQISKNKDRGLLLNYFMEYNMRNMIEHLTEF